MDKFKGHILFFGQSLLNSYAVVFFSGNFIFAILLLAVSFLDTWSGLAGIISIVCSNLLAWYMGFNKEKIRKGLYGFNSLLVGLGLGIAFDPGLPFYIFLIFSSVLTLFLTISFENIIGKYALPFLSIPFLIVIWTALLAARHYGAIHASERSLYILNDIYATGGSSFVKQYHDLNALPIHESLIIYFKSLGAIFFQNNVIAGIIIAAGILIYSRIAFTLSVLGYFAAYFFYMLIGNDISELSYNYIGFNFILTSIAIGGYFIVPSRASYFWVIVLVPLIAIISTASGQVFGALQLSVYSLPFNIVVLVFLYILKFRAGSVLKIEEVRVQQNVPELNLYSQQNNRKRFDKLFYCPIALPFWGEWVVSQGHDGTITHGGEWKYAWDFVLQDDIGKTFRNQGLRREDYYCFGKPVLAPGDGVVEEVVNFVTDNEIGDVNVNDNWGNTVVIRHAPGLFSKVCHLMNGSVKIQKGDAIRKGDIIASVGNSGRSPEPHLHFQLQATPFIGSKTIDYPVGFYMWRNGTKFELKQYDRPQINERISNVEYNILLSKAYYFIPGKKINYLVTDQLSGKQQKLTWEYHTDFNNQSFIYCPLTGSKAYFYNNGYLHYFSHFSGNRNSLLYYFFMASYKVLLGYYRDLELKDQYPVHLLNNPALLIAQDFVAPFFMFIKSDYHIQYDFIDDYMTSGKIILKSSATMKIGGAVRKRMNFELEFSSDRLSRISINGKKKSLIAVCVD